MVIVTPQTQMLLEKRAEGAVGMAFWGGLGQRRASLLGRYLRQEWELPGWWQATALDILLSL